MALFHPVRLLKSKQFEKKKMMRKKIFYLQKILWLKKTTFIVSLGANFQHKSNLVIFLKIKELSERGINIKAIKKVLEEGDLSLELDVEIIESLKDILKILKNGV